MLMMFCHQIKFSKKRRAQFVLNVVSFDDRTLRRNITFSTAEKEEKKVIGPLPRLIDQFSPMHLVLSIGSFFQIMYICVFSRVEYSKPHLNCFLLTLKNKMLLFYLVAICKPSL